MISLAVVLLSAILFNDIFNVEQVYGISTLPGYGRDSYSAYKIADATIDDSENLVSSSAKRDNQVLRNVERTIVSCVYSDSLPYDGLPLSQ